MRNLPGLFALSLFASPFPTARTKFVTVRGRKIIAPDGTELHLRGIGLGNWLVQEAYMFKLEGDVYTSPREIHDLVAELVGPAEARVFWREFHENYIARDDIAFIRKAGFNSIRVPFNYRLLTPEEFPGVWLDSGFGLLDRVINWSTQEGLYVILDMHCAPGGQTGSNIDDSWGYPWLYESPESQQRVAEVWRRIAERYSDNPTVLGYDLMNEPLPNWPELRKYDPMLEPILKRITSAIREVDPNHIVILEGVDWDSSLRNFGPPFDSKSIYSFHKYWTSVTQESIQPFLDFRDKYDVPIWLGESGENTNQWITDLVQLAERNDIGWSFWPYKKMDSTRGVVSFDVPIHWDEIQRFAKICGGVSSEERRKARFALPIEDCRAALSDFIVKCQFNNCRINPDCLKALHLKRQ